MLKFHKISIADKPMADRYIFDFGSRSAEHDFGNMFFWSADCRQLAEYGGRLVVLNSHEGKNRFSFPVGKGELRPVIDAMRDYAKENDFPFVIIGVEDEGKAQLEALYPKKFSFEEVREYADYVYSVEKLSTLSGKKLHAKRNHINRFTLDHSDWRFEEMRSRHFPLCRKLFEEWAQSIEGSTQSIETERAALSLAFDNFDTLGLFGGVLFLGGELIAFTIGEQCSNDCVDTHFEKAVDINGAYAMINREFALHISKTMPHIRYINREEDMGLENLRRAKLSYHPEFLIAKYTAHWRD